MWSFEMLPITNEDARGCSGINKTSIFTSLVRLDDCEKIP